MEIDVLIGICIIAIMVIIYMKYKKPSYKTETKCENIKRTEDTIDTYDDKGNKRVSVGIYKPNEKSTEEEITYIKDGVQGKGIMKRMAQGLQIFDENGKCILDITNRLPKVLGIRKLTEQVGNIYEPEINGKDVWVSVRRSFKTERAKELEIYELDGCSPTITIEGSYIKWAMNTPSIVRYHTYTLVGSFDIASHYWEDLEFEIIYGVY